MAQTEDPKITAAEVGRVSLKKMVEEFAGVNRMERLYQQTIGDLRAKEAFEGMSKEVEDLPEFEKATEILSRFFVALMMQTKPEQRPTVIYQLYTHLRATGIMGPVKAKLVLIPGPEGGAQ